MMTKRLEGGTFSWPQGGEKGPALSRAELAMFFFQAEDGIRDSGDWSSDVCSSDLEAGGRPGDQAPHQAGAGERQGQDCQVRDFRSEERRVGEERRSRWSAYH